MDMLQRAVPVVVLVFVVSSMLAMGLGLTVMQIIAPLRNARLVAMSLVANFVLMPLAAVALAKMQRLHEPLGVGLLLLGAAGMRAARRQLSNELQRPHETRLDRRMPR